MKQLRIFLLSAVAILVAAAFAKETRNLGRAVDLKASDAAILKASYFAAAKPGPAVLVYHQSNRTRKERDVVARQLAAAGINTVTVDVRGHGESGGQESRGEARQKQWPLDVDAAFEYLISQPGVKGDV